MKHLLLTLAAVAIMGGQSATAQNRVKNITAESAKLNVTQVDNQDVRLSRYLFAGYNTICLPMSVSSEQLEKAAPGTKIERLAAIAQEAGTLNLYFVDCTTEGIEAGMPYLIFSPTAKYLTLSNEGRALNDAISTVRMADGEGNQIAFSSSWEARTKEGLYGIPAKQNVPVLESILIRTTGDQSFRPTRCGFSWESQSATATQLVIKHARSISDVTGLTSVKSNAAMTDVYDLKGNVVMKQVKTSDVRNSLPAGVYIVNGQKVTVK